MIGRDPDFRIILFWVTTELRDLQFQFPALNPKEECSRSAGMQSHDRALK